MMYMHNWEYIYSDYISVFCPTSFQLRIDEYRLKVFQAPKCVQVKFYSGGIWDLLDHVLMHCDVMFSKQTGQQILNDSGFKAIKFIGSCERIRIDKIDKTRQKFDFPILQWVLQNWFLTLWDPRYVHVQLKRR